jgi:hypothetical protein
MEARSAGVPCKRHIFLNFRTAMFHKRRRTPCRHHTAKERTIGTEGNTYDEATVGKQNPGETMCARIKAAMEENLYALEKSLEEQKELFNKLRCEDAELRAELSGVEGKFKYEQGLLVESYESSIKRLRTEAKANGNMVAEYERCLDVAVRNLSELLETCEALGSILDFGELGDRLVLYSRALSLNPKLLREMEGITESVQCIEKTCESIGIACCEMASSYEASRSGRTSELEELKKLNRSKMAAMAKLADEMAEMDEVVEKMARETKEMSQDLARDYALHSMLRECVSSLERQVSEAAFYSTSYKEAVDEVTEGLMQQIKTLGNRNTELGKSIDRLQQNSREERNAIGELRGRFEDERRRHALTMQDLEDARRREERLMASNDEERTRSKFLEAQLLECDLIIKGLNEERPASGDPGLTSENSINAALQIGKLKKKHQAELGLLSLRIEELEMMNNELRERLGAYK